MEGEKNMEKNDYQPIWKDLELNLEGYDQLLAVLGKAYKDIYLSSQEGSQKTLASSIRWRTHLGAA